jgi:hypothetical protein
MPIVDLGLHRGIVDHRLSDLSHHHGFRVFVFGYDVMAAGIYASSMNAAPEGILEKKVYAAHFSLQSDLGKIPPVHQASSSPRSFHRLQNCSRVSFGTQTPTRLSPPPSLK